MFKTVTVSIGRGIPGGGEMTTREWRRFKAEVRAVLGWVALREGSSASDRGLRRGEIYVDAAKTFGEWEGQREESATWVASIWAGEAETLEGSLRSICADFGQDAIALTVGDTTLVTGA